MHKLALKLLVSMGVFYVVPMIFPSIRLDSPQTVLWAGLVLVLVNLLIRPLLILLTLPFNLLTLGLFTLVINTWMVMLTSKVVAGLHIPGFWPAFAVALIISASNLLFRRFFRNSGQWPVTSGQE